jgi:hypothetical protein
MEAVALDLPPEAGYVIHDGIVDDELFNWTEEQFLHWCNALVLYFGVHNEDSLNTLYRACIDLMESYGEMMLLD